MYEPETAFRKLVHKTLKSPTSAKFDLAEWRDALKTAKDLSADDARLAITAAWISAQSEALREYPGLTFEQVGRGLWVTLALAAANREFRIAYNKRADYYRSRGKIEDGTVDASFEPLLTTRFGGEVTATGVTENVVDTLESWMFDLREGPVESASPPADLAPLITRVGRRMSFQRELNRLWNRASWEDYRIDVRGEELRWVPQDFDLAAVSECTTWRHLENSQNLAMIDMSIWKDMPIETRRKRMLVRTVAEVTQRRGGPRKPRFAAPNPGVAIDNYAFECAFIEGSYLQPYMDRDMPLAPGLNASLLLRAWHVIADFARATKGELDVKTLSAKSARALAGITKRSELLVALKECLSIDEVKAASVLDFLTFHLRRAKEKGHRGMWSAPLVAIPGEERFGICLGALLTSNPLRKVEGWLVKGGVDDTLARDARGDLYEMNLRKRIRDQIAENPLLPGVRCAEHGIKKSDEFPEQIDLLIRLGSLLLVAEVKCWIFPADPFERWLYFDKLRAAAVQARRKACAIDQHRGRAAEALGVPEAEVAILKAVPLIVTNQGFAFSMEINGCRVVDERFLSNYLGSGSLITGLTVEKGQVGATHHSTTYYRTESEASARFESILARPPTLYRFKDRVEWRAWPFPMAAGSTISVMVPHLREMTAPHQFSSAAEPAS